MKKIIFILLFIQIFFINKTKAQNDCWYYSYQEFGVYGYVKIESISDTMIKGKLCKILLKTRYIYNDIFDYFATTILGQEYIFNSNDTVYRYKYSKFYPLYIFNGSIGSEYEIAGNNMDNNCDSIGRLKIDSVGITYIHDDTLKWISVSPALNSTFGIYGKIIEKIGPINNYMFPEYVNCIVDANEGGFLRCYFENQLLYFTSNITPSCNYIYTDINEISNCFLSIYPNPADETIYMEFKNMNFDLKTLNIEIINTLGQTELLDKWDIFYKDVNKKRIDLSHLNNGIYFIILKENNIIFVKKLFFKISNI